MQNATPPGKTEQRGWRRWLPRRLEHQLMGLTAACLLASNVGYGFYTAERQTALARHSLDAQMVALAQNLATISANLLLVEDLNGIDAIATQVATVPGIVGLLVTDVAGAPLSEVVSSQGHWTHRFQPGPLKVPRRIAAVTLPEDEAVNGSAQRHELTQAAWHPVLAANHLGWVRVTYRLDHLDHDATGIWLRALALVALAIGLSLGGMWLLLRRPMGALRATAGFAASLDPALGTQLTIGTSTVEIEALGLALNSLSARLHSQHTDLSKQRTALDQHVAASVRAEADSARIAAVLRGAIDAIDEAFVLYDPDDRLVICNDKYRETYPSVAHLMVPGTTFEQIIRPGAENGDYADAIGRVDEWVAERMAAHRSGDVTLVQRLSSGRTLRIIERKMADGHIVGFRVDISELMQATEAAQAASRAKSQFLANTSHEIRTPMNAILGMLKLLRRTDLNERQADYASKAEDAARSLLGLLNDVLDLSKFEAGKMELEAQPFHVDQLMREVAVIALANLGAKPVQVRFDIDPAVPRQLVGDAMRLRQVMVNLSGNAIKFTAQGEVVVSIQLERQDAASVRLAIAVRDTGIGIAPENQARIFSGFTQAEASTTRRFGGTGLGLAISQRLVQLMGGELQLDSALGHGSRFHFCISMPVADGIGTAAEAAHQGPLDLLQLGIEAMAAPGGPISQRLAGMRLLLVEDNPNNQQVARELLQDEGATVQVAPNGQAAVHAVASTETPFDVVLMDLQMPVMDGFTATTRIRQDLGLRSLPIVAMTANASASDQAACRAAGMNDHVSKPFDLDHLVRVLRHQAGRSDLPATTAATGMGLPANVLCAAALANVQVDAAIQRLGGKLGVHTNMLRRFLVDLDSAPHQLQAAAIAGDAPAMARCLHTIKGAASALGADAMADQAAELERALGPVGSTDDARVASAASCASTAARARTVLARQTPGLQALLVALQQAAPESFPAQAASDTAAAAAIDPAALRQGLRRLAELLRQSDMAALDAMAGLPGHGASALGERLREIEALVAELAFEPALNRCQDLLESLQA